MHKCSNDNCPYRISALKQLNPAEQNLRRLKSSQFKLCYIYREYLFEAKNLITTSPLKPTVDIRKIYNSPNVLGLILSFLVSFAMSARKTAYIMRVVFNVNVSHQTVLNYAEAAAFHCHQFNMKFKGPIDNESSGDETYIKIAGKTNFVFLFTSAKKHTITTYHVADNREALPAIIAMNEAIRDWVTNVRNTFYIIGSVAGPHPYPMMVRDFQSVIGRETRTQIKELEKRLPDALVACVGGGSNAMGLFYPFIKDKGVAMYGVEAAGEGVATGHHAATLCAGRPGVLHGNRTYLLETEDGQITETHSISAGLDYPGVGPEHAYLKDSGRAQYVSITDKEALESFHELTRTEGIMPALESSHALAYAKKLAPELGKDKLMVINLSGRGDKDIHTVASLEGISF